MKNFKSHFDFSKQERSGVFYLLLLIITVQIGYYAYSKLSNDVEDRFVVNSEEQAKIDILRNELLAEKKDSIYPFNPNFITDYKGYILGMSVQEIDRLHRFRKKKTFVNSAKEFQEVTHVSDSLLGKLQVYFKFPDWTKKKEEFIVSTQKKNRLVKGLNSCNSEDLVSISGVGEVLANRILKFRNALGGFLIEDQLYDVYGLDAEVVNRVLKQYKVINPPLVKKININTATASELSKLVYIQKNTSIYIINYRMRNDSIYSFEELQNIENFPYEKIDKIKLYLKLK